MIKALGFSIALHALAVALILVLTGSWFDHEASSALNPRIDIDVLRVGEEPGRGEKKQAAKQPQTREQVPASTTADTKSTIEGAPQSTPPAETAPAADSSGAGTDKVTIDGDGRPLSLTTQEFISWIRSNNEAPGYPRLARMRGEQGTVQVKVSLNSRGMPAEKIELQSSSGSELLDRVALEAVRSWRFPAFRGRDRLEIVFPFRFSLEDG